jgi:hypothetical protein
MAIFQKLSLLAVRQLILGATQSIGLVAAGEVTERVFNVLVRRFSDHSLKLVKALETANDRAWQTLTISLAGDTFFSRCRVLLAPREEQAFRTQVRALLEQIGPKESGEAAAYRQTCLRELKAARKAGHLQDGFDAQALAREAGNLARFGEPDRLLEAERSIVNDLADDLDRQGYVNVSRYLSLTTSASGATLLCTAVRYFFRREIETDQELFQGLAFAQLEKLDQAQQEGFGALGDLLQQHGARLEELFEEMREAVLETHEETCSTSRQSLLARGRTCASSGRPCCAPWNRTACLPAICGRGTVCRSARRASGSACASCAGSSPPCPIRPETSCLHCRTRLACWKRPPAISTTPSATLTPSCKASTTRWPGPPPSTISTWSPCKNAAGTKR